MISFSLGKTRFCIYFSFLMFNAVIFMSDSAELILSFYAVCALHEAGHIVAAAAVGQDIKSISFSAGGIRMLTGGGLCQTAVILAGPAVNLTLFAMLRALGCNGSFTMLSLAAGLYNLLPYRSLDGGALIDSFAVGSIHEREVNAVLITVKLLITAAAAYLTVVTHNAAFPLLAVSVLLFVEDTLCNVPRHTK